MLVYLITLKGYVRMVKAGEYGKPRMPEQPGSAERVLFLRLESRASTSMPDYKDSTVE